MSSLKSKQEGRCAHKVKVQFLWHAVLTISVISRDGRINKIKEENRTSVRAMNLNTS
jgi:hypothetical protein